MFNRIHINTRTESIPAKHCNIARQSMLFTLTVSVLMDCFPQEGGKTNFIYLTRMYICSLLSLESYPKQVTDNKHGLVV